jgi:hypothetical protein
MLEIRLPAGPAKAIEVSASRDRQLDWDQRPRSKLIGCIREREEKHWLHHHRILILESVLNWKWFDKRLSTSSSMAS